MTTQTKTHWKKNNDSRYISGEDLHSGLNGLLPEMAVIIIRFEDAETFDQSNNKTIIKTGLYLATLDNKPIYKPVILNNTNAKFCVKEFNSEFMEDWIGKPIVLYAQADRRHGYVARFKKYYANQKPIEQPKISEADVQVIVEQMDLIDSLKGLQEYWLQIGQVAQRQPVVIAAKETAKTRLS